MRVVGWINEGMMREGVKEGEKGGKEREKTGKKEEEER